MTRFNMIIRPILLVTLTVLWPISAMSNSNEDQDQDTIPEPNWDSVATPSIPSNFPRVKLAPQVGPAVRCNSRATCPDGRGVIQSEVSLAVSGDTMVCTYNDFRGFYCPDLGYQVGGWAYSTDGGATFTDGNFLPGHTNLRGDPWLVTGVYGVVYYANIWGSTAGLAVLRSQPPYEWPDPTVQTVGGSFDKEALAADPVTGTIYLSYTRFGGPGGIHIFRSYDGAASFEGPFPVRTGGGLQGSFPLVGLNGEVFVAYNAGSQTQFAKSLDGASTFGPPVNLGAVCNFAVSGASRTPPFPQMAIDATDGPNSGNLYVVWHSSCPRGTGDAVMSRSSDGGDTWSPVQVVNDDSSGAVHFFPTVSVDALGQVNVFFYDRRENPGTTVTDLYYAKSTDGGASFNTNIRMNDISSTWALISEGTPNYGDYISSLSMGTTACVAYADGRDGDPDAYIQCVDTSE